METNGTTIGEYALTETGTLEQRRNTREQTKGDEIIQRREQKVQHMGKQKRKRGNQRESNLKQTGGTNTKRAHV